MTGLAATWPAPPAQPLLRRDEAHVWRAELDVDEAQSRRLEGSLSPDERSRAARFRRPIDRRRFVIAHGLLRHVLSRYLPTAPWRLAFDRGGHGKPTLRGTRLDFNMSHAGGLALYAVSGGGPVGVDVEQVQDRIDHVELAAQFFSARERAALRSLPPADRQGAFFACWTRKEALLKARGDGLALPLDAFDVSIGQPARLLGFRGPLRSGGPWWIRDCVAGPGYAAAVAGEGRTVELVRWRWTG